MYKHLHRGGAGRIRESKKLNTYLKKTMTENFFNLEKEIDIKVQEAQRVPNKTISKRPTPRYIIIRMREFKDKERSSKETREKQLVTYKGAPRNSQLISQQKLCRLEGDWQEIFKVIKRKDLQPRLLYPAKLSFRIKEG